MDIRESNIWENLKRAAYMSEKEFSTLCTSLVGDEEGNKNIENFINIAIIKRKKLASTKEYTADN